MSATATSTALSSADKPPRRFPPPCWTQDEALALIKAYRDRWYALRRGYLRTADWDAVADHVGRLSPGAIPPKTSAQCRHKMEKLRQRYRAEKQRALSFPAGHFLSTWFYFNAMDSMEKNGNGSNPDDDLNPVGMQIVNSKINHQSNTIIDPIYGALNPGRGIRFKPVAPDNNLVTIASRAHNVRVSQNSQEEDNDDEFDDVYYSETLIGNNNSGKNHRLSSQNYAGARPRKFSRIGSNPNNNNNNNNSYWNENGEEEDDDDDDDDNENGEDDVWVKMRKERNDRKSGRDYNDSIGQIVSSIKVLADGFVKMEKMKMDMVHEIEKMRMEAEMKRNKLLLESQKQMVEAFVKGLSENKRQHQ